MNRMTPIIRVSVIWLFAATLIALGSYVGCGGGPKTNNNNDNVNNTTNGNTNKNENVNNTTNNNKPPECKTDGDCPPGKTCEAGACKEEVGGTDVETVEIVPTSAVTRKDGTAKLEAVALNKAGARLTKAFTYKWSSSDDKIAAVDQTGNVTGGASSGTATITAEVEGKKGTATITNYGDVEAGKVRVIVLDGDGKAISGATVKVSDGEGTTDDKGTVIIDGKTPPFDVHVFHKDYSYFSAYGVNKTDLLVNLAKPQDVKKAGGVDGEFGFDQVQALLGVSDEDWPKYNVGFGIAGLSLPANILELNFDLLLGESVKATLPVINQELDLPGGIVISISDKGKPEFKALGADGKRLMWGFGGKFQLTELLPLIPKDTKNINIGEILVKAKPLLQKMTFGFDANINVTAGKTEKKTLVLKQKLEEKFTVNVTSIPKFKDKDGKDVELIAVSLAGVIIPGLGLVPTGLMVEQGGTGSATLEVLHAKRGGVLAQGQFAVITLALTLPLGDNPPPLYIFGNIQTFASPPSSINVSGFASLATDAKFDPATRALTGGKSGDASIYHFTFTGTDGKAWTVVYPKGGDGFTLPAVPSGMSDPISADGEASLRSAILKDGNTMDTLIEFNATNMSQLTEVLISFSNSTVYEKPKTP